MSSNTPRGVIMYLLEVTRETVEFVHADRVGDRAQIERAQMFDALGEKSVLQPHDFRGDLQNGALALFEAFRQPVGVLQTGRDEGFVAVAASPRR